MTLLTERPKTSSSATVTTLKTATALSLTPQCAAAAT